MSAEVKSIYRTAGFTEALPPISGAVEALNQMLDEGFEVKEARAMPAHGQGQLQLDPRASGLPLYVANRHPPGLLRREICVGRSRAG